MISSPKSPSKPSILTQNFSAIFKPSAFSRTNFEINFNKTDKFSQQNSIAAQKSNAIVIENINFNINLADNLVSAICNIWFHDEFWPGKSGFMLYEEHVRGLRVIIKHILSFVTVDTSKYFGKFSAIFDKTGRLEQSQASTINTQMTKDETNFFGQNADGYSSSELYVNEIMSQIQALQTSLVQRHVQPKIFYMLQNIFECYNMPPKILSGAYFRTIVELWLTYIQPWRYTEGNSSGMFNNSGIFSGADKNKLPENLETAKYWLPYITSNLDCYTTLFIDILRRALLVGS